MAPVEEITKSATGIAQALIAADAKVTMAGKKPQEMKDHAASVMKGALTTVQGCIDAMALDPIQFEKDDADTIAIRAIALSAFGTKIGGTVK